MPTDPVLTASVAEQRAAGFPTHLPDCPEGRDPGDDEAPCTCPETDEARFRRIAAEIHVAGRVAAEEGHRVHCLPAADALWILDRLATAGAAKSALIAALLARSEQAAGNWALGTGAGIVHSALVGEAHHLDHPDCEDSTVGHLTEWRAAWVTAHPEEAR